MRKYSKPVRKSSLVVFLFFLMLLSLSAWWISGCSREELTYSSDIPLPEHPRPDFERDLWINLNGSWEFAPDSSDVGEMFAWQDSLSVFDEEIIVPFSWASPLSTIRKKDFHIGWYARDITFPRGGEWKNKQIYLVIGASDFTTTVWLNGKLVGEHEGGYTPFEFDLTGFITGKGQNRLVMRVEDMPVPDRLVGKQVYGEAKGIWQTVYLEGRSEDHLKQVHFIPDIDREKVSVEVLLAKPSAEDLDLAISFKDDIVETAWQTIPAGRDSVVFDIPIPTPHLWNLDDPFLYELDLSLSRGDREYDHVYSYFGMREIGTAKLPGSGHRYITLNGRPVYLKMALDQAYHQTGFYTFPTDEFMRDEILRAKALGLNGLRIHIKTELPRKLYWADKLGLLIQADVPNIAGEPDKDAQRNWEYTAFQQIRRDFNHPSIFSWVLFNETWGLKTINANGIGIYLPKTREWVRSLYHRVKELDPTRLVEDNSPCNEDHVATDINSWHRYLPAREWASYLDYVVENTYSGSRWNYIGTDTQPDIPMMNSECGAVWGYQYGTGDIDITYEYHIMMNELRRRPKVAGFIFTEFHDVINEWNGYYRYDRSPKDFGLGELCPGMTMNDFHTDMYLIPGSDFETVVKPDSVFAVPITASFMTDSVPPEMTVKTLVHGWNSRGEHRTYHQGQFAINPQPYQVFEAGILQVTAPPEECLAVLCTSLVTVDGKVFHNNFFPFRVAGEDSAQVIATVDTLRVTDAAVSGEADSVRTVSGDKSREDSASTAQPMDDAAADSSIVRSADADSLRLETRTRFMRIELPDENMCLLRVSPQDFSAAEWSVMQYTVMDSMKVWGTGTGFFEYTFPWPAELGTGAVSEGMFLAELSARRIQGKYLAEGSIQSQSISAINRKGIDPGYSPNSYPMTDTYRHPSSVIISANGIPLQTVALENDPADHRGLLSWINQPRGSLHWNQTGGSLNWKLNEAGSYGYLVRIAFPPEVVEKASQEGAFRIRLSVNEASTATGGLAVYGERFGRFPVDPTIQMKLTEPFPVPGPESPRDGGNNAP